MRTALFKALYARYAGGGFLLRLENADFERSRDEPMAALADDLRWLDLAWQEGPDSGGGCAGCPPDRLQRHAGTMQTRQWCLG